MVTLVNHARFLPPIPSIFSWLVPAKEEVGIVKILLTRFALIILCILFWTGCDLSDGSSNAITGNWLANGTFATYGDEITTTWAQTVNMTYIFNADGSLTIDGTSQWEDSTPQVVSIIGTYVYDENGQTLDFTYTSFSLDGVYQSAIPYSPVFSCIIEGDQMSLTNDIESPLPHTPAETWILTRL